MAWDRQFVDDLGRGTEAPRFIVRAVAMPEQIGPVWEIGGPARADLLSPGLVDRVDIGGSKVSTDTWSASTGSITITLIGDVSGLLPRVSRGQIVEVLAGFSGYADSEYAQIAIGQVFSFSRRGVGARYTMVLRDIWAALSSRISTSADELSLFAGLPSATTVLANYTATDATIDVSGGAEFPKETGGNGAFSVVDDGGDTFYITWSSSVFIAGPGRRYTIVTAGALSTIDANAGAGNEVVPLAYIKDEPVDIVRKILTSTGSGTNGAYDTLPKTWGYGIPDRLLDHADITNTRKFTRTDNADRDWEAWSADAQDDGLSWIFGTVFQAGGWFPAIHQGSMTIRAAVEPYTASPNLDATTPRSDVPFIDDSVLARENPLDRWEAWSPDHSIEYYRVTAVAGVSTHTITEPVGALPSEDTFTIDVSPWVHNNKPEHLASLVHRLHVWAHRLPERFTISMHNLRLAGHSIGGLPRLTSGVLHGRLASTSGGFDNVPVLVTQVSTDWEKRTMSMSFEVVSDSSDDF
jgi:hypothetical protein